MTTSTLAAVGRPRRVLQTLVDGVVYFIWQMFYLAGEGLGRLTQNSALTREMRAVRKSVRYYWTARTLRRQGRTEEAFAAAKCAFAALGEADRRQTYLQIGGMAIALLDRLARERITPGGSESELVEALEVFRAMQTSSRPSAALDLVVNWLEQRVKTIA